MHTRQFLSFPSRNHTPNLLKPHPSTQVLQAAAGSYQGSAKRHTRSQLFTVHTPVKLEVDQLVTSTNRSSSQGAGSPAHTAAAARALGNKGQLKQDSNHLIATSSLLVHLTPLSPLPSTPAPSAPSISPFSLHPPSLLISPFSPLPPLSSPPSPSTPVVPTDILLSSDKLRNSSPKRQTDDGRIQTVARSVSPSLPPSASTVPYSHAGADPLAQSAWPLPVWLWRCPALLLCQGASRLSQSLTFG